MKKFSQNIVKLKEISTIKDFRFGTFPSISGSGYTFYRPPSGTAKVKIVKKERDPVLFTSKQLIKF
jgi:hypothetical protein